MKILVPIAAIGLPLGGCAVHNLNHALNGNIPVERFERSTLRYDSPTAADGYEDNPQSARLGETTEKNLRKKHGEKAFVGEEVDAARAEFNRTGNLDVLNRFFPYRSSLSLLAAEANDVQTRQAYLDKISLHDMKIAEVVDSPQAQFWFADGDNRVYPLDTSTRYIIAGLIVDLMHNRMDLVRETLEKKSPMRFVLFEKLSKRNLVAGSRDVGGYWAPLSGDIEMDSRSFWRDSGVRGDGEDTPVHEFVHAAESRNLILGIHLADGMLPGLSTEDELAFRQERRRLRAEFSRLNGGLGYGALKSRGKAMKSPEGFRAYTFKNAAEFLSTTHESFFDNGKAFKEASPVLYDIYSRYYRLDTANGYRDLIEEDSGSQQQPARFA